jgi:hypothetical protein
VDIQYGREVGRVSGDRWGVARTAKTLWQAHEALSALRPAKGASSSAWREYYLRSAAVYAEIAEIDRGHHHEALYWANRERRKAEEFGSRDKPEVSTNPQ